ncbi:hypothetical protein L1987_04569 [Smallanthus sonchifolius]|uniref:Uncharacterized protein n=1 Tax=Smallanthus sonchifolius TaxID=185202 RepID=A0ACB9JSY0_9ASTR|nr:hypothetical protein L1987_04569 [Smallanthus sonchifolius]
MTNNNFHKFMHLVFFVLVVLLVWLKITTATLIDIPNGDGESYKCIDKERHVLLNFKSYIHQDPNGFLSTWIPEGETNDCCKWWGVTCNNQTGHVTSLDLSFGNLEGKISHSLLNLRYLHYLDLSNNSFNGTIPMFIGSMTHLRYLNLGLNDFTGTIPSELGNLANLKKLSLRYMGSCTVEDLDWLSRLSELEDLDMSGTSLRKADNWVDVILSLQKLSYLILEGCDISQVKHPYSFSTVNSSFSLSIVTLISLKNNNLNSSMYHWLFPLTSNALVELDLSENKLDGIPKYLGNLCSLTSLYIHNNLMPTKFPDFLNNLSGCTSAKLQTLDASNTQFTGSLSDDIQKFSSLKYMLLSNNQLNGTISERVWQLPKLRLLDVSSNSLKGAISGNIGKSKIVIIDLSNNSLEVVPSEADMLTLSNVGKIDLSSNNFSGPISNVSSTVWLDISKNKLYGRISFLCRIVHGSLLFLDLSDNSLIGQIPDCLSQFRKLRVLNLGQNRLSGRLPASIEYLINLEVLYLYNNSFSGELPLSLKNCINLTFLELGANKFSGYVPVWIGEKLSRLYALRLTSNNFYGTIPLQLCQLVNLTILDLSVNYLYGPISSCLSDLTAMVQGGFSHDQNVHNYPWGEFSGEYIDHAMIKWQGNAREFSSTLGMVKSIDLSSNNLTGNIPYELTDIHELIALNLSKNALFGEIPPKIGHMKKLLCLDLSRNNLSGRIPTSMSEMTSLDYLDVSYNNLLGSIPSSTQLQSFEPSRYTGNVGLCGLPLTKYCPKDGELEVAPPIGESEGGSEDIDALELRYCFILV